MAYQVAENHANTGSQPGKSLNREGDAPFTTAD
jgi:hypothetical protein